MIMEDLASNGLIVVSVAHPYGTNIKYLDDSHIIRTNKQIDKIFENAWLEAKPFENNFQGLFINNLPTVAAYEYLYTNERQRQNIINNWEKDNNCVISFIENLSNTETSLFYKSVDLLKIGVFGHSLGGQVPGNLCAHSENVIACAFIETDPFSDYFYTNMVKTFFVHIFWH